MNTNRLATNIKYYRKQNNWTQQKLAEELNISRSVIAKWENEDVLPDLPALLKLSSLFQQSLDQLLGIYSNDEQTLSDFQQLYSTKNNPTLETDENMMKIIDYLIKNPLVKEQILQMIDLPVKRQKSVQRILKTATTEIERL
ncbi:transcriptional regulator with XRE-family HTH domain [Natronobacillus azotifigens]|uniref:Helix-turn-helix transcriptional regulator n=1 Tax=Natronobacillus azotifigens TaxID=472978 RepID=A0A9J6RBE7_9BACI|nr:helix-turn-helix transcriptional regulator [Natronobacillus azotifigens]MCZ0702861.1 helix-turn-helix transcriptional regulator [Natronobacillus azotifigens]